MLSLHIVVASEGMCRHLYCQDVFGHYALTARISFCFHAFRYVELQISNDYARVSDVGVDAVGDDTLSIVNQVRSTSSLGL